MVFENLHRSFPEKDDRQIRKIASEFYRHFSELVMETIKVMDFKEGEMDGRISFRNAGILDRYFDQGISVVAVAAHYGNWEWLQSLAQNIRHKPIAVYKPQNNKDMDAVLNRQRSKFGAEIVSMRDIIRVLRQYNRQKKPTLSMYISDQSPVWEEIQYWTMFMNQLTPVYLGPEKIAREFGMAVVFLKMHVISRGCYEVEIIPITEDASLEPEYAITEKHLHLLQETIREKPEYWLWSHRRWKLTRKREQEEAKGRFKFEGQFLRKHRKRVADA